MSLPLLAFVMPQYCLWLNTFQHCGSLDAAQQHRDPSRQGWGKAFGKVCDGRWEMASRGDGNRYCCTLKLQDMGRNARELAIHQNDDVD